MPRQKENAAKENWVKITSKKTVWKWMTCGSKKLFSVQKFFTLYTEWKSSSHTWCFVYHIEYLCVYVMRALCVRGFALKGVKCRNIFILLLHCLYRRVVNIPYIYIKTYQSRFIYNNKLSSYYTYCKGNSLVFNLI